MAESTTDCRSEDGITVGLIDAVISICRVLLPRLEENDSSPDVVEALRDLHSDVDFSSLDTLARRAELLSEKF